MTRKDKVTFMGAVSRSLGTVGPLRERLWFISFCISHARSGVQFVEDALKTAGNKQASTGRS